MVPALAARCGLNNAQCCTDDPDKRPPRARRAVIRQDDLVLYAPPFIQPGRDSHSGRASSGRRIGHAARVEASGRRVPERRFSVADRSPGLVGGRTQIAQFGAFCALARPPLLAVAAGPRLSRWMQTPSSACAHRARRGMSAVLAWPCILPGTERPRSPRRSSGSGCPVRVRRYSELPG